MPRASEFVQQDFAQTLMDRVEHASRYIGYRQTISPTDWMETFSLYKAGQLPLEAGLALIHKDYWSCVSPPGGVITVLGPTSFEGISPVRTCESQRVFGYRCPRIEPTLHQDHLFPRSLGGPTVGTNRITLCDLHNYYKGMDIHFFPWEDGTPSWLEGLLTYLSSLVSK
jgi:hypothetical protein